MKRLISIFVVDLLLISSENSSWADWTTRSWKITSAKTFEINQNHRKYTWLVFHQQAFCQLKCKFLKPEECIGEDDFSHTIMSQCDFWYTYFSRSKFISPPPSWYPNQAALDWAPCKGRSKPYSGNHRTNLKLEILKSLI